MTEGIDHTVPTPEHSPVVQDFLAVTHDLIERFPTKTIPDTSRELILSHFPNDPTAYDERVIVTTQAPKDEDTAQYWAAGTPRVQYTYSDGNGNYEAGQYVICGELVIVKGADWSHDEVSGGPLEDTVRVLSQNEIAHLVSRLTEAQPPAKKSPSFWLKLGHLTMRFRNY